MTAPLRIVRLVLDRRSLSRLAARHRLPRGVDDGYLVHAGLSQLFAVSREPAEVPLHNFALDDTNVRAAREPGSVFVLAYSDLEEGGLLARMGAARDGLVRECASRDVPSLDEGMDVGFRVRVCPVVRTKQPGGRDLPLDRKGKRRSREVDAWLVDRFGRWEQQLPSEPSLERQGREWIDRERVYATWLAQELARFGAAAMGDQVSLESFARERMHRRGGSPGARLQRPNAVMRGVLRISDGEAFRRLLRRGIGRHRAFGFGMLLLRRPGYVAC